MKNTERVSRMARAFLAASFMLIGIQTAAHADLERIREKAVELEQKLNKHHYEVSARGEDSNTLRIYKDFAFLLKESKVDEAREAEGFEAARLKHFLIESAVNFELASYLDDLNKFERTGTADFNGVPTTYHGLINQLANAEVDKDRRAIYTALKGMVETANIYRNQIVTRRNELFQAWGYDNYAQFYAEKNGIDLAEVSKAAEDLLTETQAQYDALFEAVVMDQMGVEARKVKLLDIPFLLSGAKYLDAFPVADQQTRSKAVLSGLGLSSQGLVFDEKEREGRAAGWGVY
ncbi:MAG: hypothetical protein HKN21_16470, partial [Candidatus Eisenbacteria bacterium]|nr:hypothetical protein [Candidatus Eisenbacteria bacterium]